MRYGIALQPRLGVVVTSWSHEDGHEYAASLVDTFGRRAQVNQVELVTWPALFESEQDIPAIARYFANKALDAVCLVPGNFTLDHIMPLLAQALDLPTIVWGIPTTDAWGALVAAQQALYPMKELGLKYRFVVGSPDDERAWRTALSYARAAALVRRLKGLRVGLMGWRAQGMSDVTFDELALREAFGVQVVNVGLTRYVRAVQNVPEGQVQAAWEALRPQFDASAISEEVVHYGVRSYLAMKSLINQEHLQAVTVECFHDHLGGPCLGCSLCNDEGVAAACESDVPGAIIMAAGHLLSGEPTFHADIITADLPENAAIMHHCGNLPRRLAASSGKVTLAPIPEHIGPGAYGPTLQANMRPGPVTAVNLVGRRGTLRICALEADVVPFPLQFPGSAARVVFSFDLTEALEEIGNAGFGHHFAIVSGHVGRQLAEWCRLLNVEYLCKGTRGAAMGVPESRL